MKASLEATVAMYFSNLEKLFASKFAQPVLFFPYYRS
jgi:hypothetical protein